MTIFINAQYQMSLPINKIKKREVRRIICHEVYLKKAPGFDLITGKIRQELPDAGFRMITILFNAILRLGYFPLKWKILKIIMIQKPGKNENNVTSYRPISLLPLLSKVFEKINFENATTAACSERNPPGLPI